jgi:hypothetical protein
MIHRRIEDFKESLSQDLIDKILDKISRSGKQSLSIDELSYLDQYKKGKFDKGLEKWLLDDSDETIGYNGKKLLYNEFEDDENLFWNKDKLIRIISNFLNKAPFTNNADWGGADTWNIKGDDYFIGKFIYIGDDDTIEVIERKLIGDEYEDDILRTIRTPKELHKLFLDIKQNKI